MLEEMMETAVPPVEVTVGESFGIGYGGIHAEGVEDEAVMVELAAAVEQHLVAVSPNAPGACIDGRGCDHCSDGQLTEARAGVPGGDIVVSYGALELVAPASDVDSSANRFAAVHERLQTNGIKSGGHADLANEAAAYATGTGCGANDKLPPILQRIHEDKQIVDNLTAALLGEEFNANYAVYTAPETLSERHSDWRPEMLIRELTNEDPHNLEILMSEHTPTHGHAEVAVVFNNVPNTTVDRDALIRDTGKQVFDVDVWRLRQLANALAEGPNAVEDAHRLLHAMVAYTAATYLTLCDGSQRPIYINGR